MRTPYHDGYRFLFGTGKRGEWLLEASGRYERLIYQALSHGVGNMLYVYDEYQNLIGIIPNSEPLCKRLYSTLNKRHKVFNTSDPVKGGGLGPAYRNCLYEILKAFSHDYSNHDYEEACELVARTFVLRAKRLTAEIIKHDRVLSASAGS